MVLIRSPENVRLAKGASLAKAGKILGESAHDLLIVYVGRSHLGPCWAVTESGNYVFCHWLVL